MQTNHEIMGNMPAQVTRNRSFAGAFHYWCGSSGARYLHTVFDPDALPELDGAVYLAVRRDLDGRRTAIDAGIIDNRPGIARYGQALAHARHSGANEIHLHLMADTARQRRDVLDDIKRRHLVRDRASPCLHSG